MTKGDMTEECEIMHMVEKVDDHFLPTVLELVDNGG